MKPATVNSRSADERADVPMKLNDERARNIVRSVFGFHDRMPCQPAVSSDTPAVPSDTPIDVATFAVRVPRGAPRRDGLPPPRGDAGRRARASRPRRVHVDHRADSGGGVRGEDDAAVVQAPVRVVRRGGGSE